MKKTFSVLATIMTAGVLLGTSSAYAIPTLQLGSLATANQPGQGTYVNYTTNGPDEDTAFITEGNSLLAAGAYGPNTLLVGGQYDSGSDWNSFGLSSFDGKGAIIMATVANGSFNNAGVSLTLNGMNPFLKEDTFSGYPNSHYPVGDGTGFDYFFYDIGDFANLANQVPDFADETGSADGQIKEFTIGVTGLDWIHFDLMALVTDERGTRIVTTMEVSPNSHDVTYSSPGNPVPEPATMLLFGTGLIGLAGMARRKRN